MKKKLVLGAILTPILILFVIGSSDTYVETSTEVYQQSPTTINIDKVPQQWDLISNNELDDGTQYVYVRGATLGYEKLTITIQTGSDDMSLPSNFEVYEQGEDYIRGERIGTFDAKSITKANIGDQTLTIQIYGDNGYGYTIETGVLLTQLVN